MAKTKTPAVKNAPIRIETVKIVDEVAFALFKEAQELAFKHDGLLGVLMMAAAALKELDAVALECDIRGMDLNSTRGVSSNYMLSDWIPRMMEATQEAIAAEKTK